MTSSFRGIQTLSAFQKNTFMSLMAFPMLTTLSASQETIIINLDCIQDDFNAHRKGVAWKNYNLHTAYFLVWENYDSKFT